jgi:transcriptional antiterminator NusG
MKGELKWYVLKVVNGQEKMVKQYLEAELKQTELTKDYIQQILIPAEKVYAMRAGKKQIRERNFFPGYILICADLSDGRILHLIKDVPNALGFLGAKGWGTNSQPVPLREKEVNKILGKVDELALGTIGLDAPVLVGETVKSSEGPFSGFSGNIEEIFEDRKKLNVTVKIFERNTPIELNYAQVDKLT